MNKEDYGNLEDVIIGKTERETNAVEQMICFLTSPTARRKGVIIPADECGIWADELKKHLESISQKPSGRTPASASIPKDEFEKEMKAERNTGYDHFTRKLTSILGYMESLQLPGEGIPDYCKRKAPLLMEAALKQIELNKMKVCGNE